MAATAITVPSFQWSAFYYGEILEALILYKRENLPELTDESDFEPFIQFIRATALVGHLNNVLLDMVANECTLPTAQLPETVRNMLRLIGYELRPATPAQADVVFVLSRVFTVPTTLVPALSQVATQQSGTTPAIPYEVLADLNIDRTDQCSFVFSYDSVSTVYTNRTTIANTIGGAWWPIWALEHPGNMLYVGHTTVMWDAIGFDPGTGAAPPDGPTDIVILEYFDGDFQDAAPTAVLNIGGGLLQFDVTSLLGQNNRAGAVVRVQFQPSGTFQDVVSTWNGTTNIVVTGLLGQSAPSTTTTDYGIGSDWRELIGALNSNPISYTLPQDLSRNWKKTTVNGITGFFTRFRCVAVTGATVQSSSVARIRLDKGKQYTLSQVVQGRSVLGETLGSSTGGPDQQFKLSQSDFILNSEIIKVDAVNWSSVLQLLTSNANDTVYRIQLGANNQATAVFGDGSNGAIPSIGQGNVIANYRYGAGDNGNVGASAITVDKTGLTFINNFWNPRVATGWSAAQSDSPTSLAQAKQEGPASIRDRDVAISPDDLVDMTINFVDATGASPYIRAFAVEEKYGPKTVGLIIVPKGGGVASSAQLTTLDTYFNGDKTAVPPVRKRFVANQQVTSSNCQYVVVNVNADVWASTNVTAQQIINALTQVLQPSALLVDGITFMWSFGGTIALSFIDFQIHGVDPTITKVVLNGWTDIVLGQNQLPTAGTFSITIHS